MTNLVKLMGGGGLDALNRLVQSEKKEGGGIESMKDQVTTLSDDLQELLRQTSARNEEVDDMFDDLNDKQQRIKEEILRQSETIKELASQLDDQSKEIKLLKEKVAHLENIKADRLWVLMELSKKVDDAILPTLVTQDEFKQNLEEIGESMNELVDKIAIQGEVLKCHVQETSEALNGKLAVAAFDAFKEWMTERVERMKRLVDDILGVTEGQEDAAFFKLMKYHCASCDRPSRMVKQPMTPALPAIEGMNKNKSAAPYAVFGQSTLRKNLRNHRNNNNFDGAKGGLSASASALLMTPLQRGNVTGYKEAVQEKRQHWRDRVERSKEGASMDGKKGGGGGAPDEEAVLRKPITDFSTSAYYQTPGPGMVKDVWRSSRPDAGEYTKTVPPQRVVAEAPGEK